MGAEGRSRLSRLGLRGRERSRAEAARAAQMERILEAQARAEPSSGAGLDPSPSPASGPEAGAARAGRATAAGSAHLHATPRPSAFTGVALRWFGKLALSHLPRHPDLGVKLARARDPLVPQAYLARLYLRMLVAVLLGLMPAVAVLVVGLGGEPDLTLLLPLLVVPVLMAGASYAWDLLRPDLEIAARRRNLESNLPYALNFMAALASAGVVPVEVFGALGAQAAYGEVAKEAAWVYRDTKVFSKDLVQALQAASRRSPSQQFEEFLQGSVNTITSGGDLKTYLLGKSEQFTQENRRKQKSFLESLGVMAESYVVVAAAAPLFLIVILSVMTLLSKGVDPTLLLNLLILLALPIIHAAFTFVLRSTRPD